MKCSHLITTCNHSYVLKSAAANKAITLKDYVSESPKVCLVSDVLLYLSQIYLQYINAKFLFEDGEPNLK